MTLVSGKVEIGALRIAAQFGCIYVIRVVKSYAPFMKNLLE